MQRALHRAYRVVRGGSDFGWGWTQGALRVLFAGSNNGASFRYRVLHQSEQLTLQNIAHACRSDHDLQLVHHARTCDLLYLCRTDDTRQVRAAITAARERNVPVLYDTDDLTWTERIVEYCRLEERHSPAEVAAFRAGFRRVEQLIDDVDALVASTDYLATALASHFGKPAYVNANALSRQAVATAEPIYRQRIASPPGPTVVMGYFSGWPKAHEPDLAVALPAIRRVLAELPFTRLRIVGHFDLALLPADLRPQVETAPFVPYERLFAEIARADINLAPIVDNPHRRAKSAVKFLEAALVGVPTVASDLEPYRDIVHGRTGFLAADDAGWYAGIMALAADPARRCAIGAAARDQVLARDTTTVRAPGFAALLSRLIAARRAAQGQSS
ncbi:MAG: glycosyltransferase [Chloroflexi bacterium]|nr:glycosyltransferase [Chloroflexota bacterium]